MELLNLSKEESLNLLNLRKDEVNLLCLDKTPLNGLTSRVGVVLDFSGSMSTLYKNGVVQAVLERLFPIALQFDDNGEMELWIFSNGFHRLDNITMENYYGYIKREIMGKYDMGGTNYAPVLQDVYHKYMIEEPAALPNYIIFITDGDNSDKQAAVRAITEISRYPIFVQFVGISNGYSTSFDFLEKLDEMDGRYVDNANFFPITNIMEEEDKVLYNKLLAEYPQWLEYPEVKQMITGCAGENPDIFNAGAGTGSSADGGKKKGFLGRLFG